MPETPVWFLGLGDPLEKGKATHSWTLGLPLWLTCKESACNAGDLGLIPGLRRSPAEGKGYPLHCSGLETKDCTVHAVTKSWTWLSHLCFQDTWTLFLYTSINSPSLYGMIFYISHLLMLQIQQFTSIIIIIITLYSFLLKQLREEKRSSTCL